MNLRCRLSHQPILGGGIRGIDYFSFLELTTDEVADLIRWTENKRKKEIDALNGKG